MELKPKTVALLKSVFGIDTETGNHVIRVVSSEKAEAEIKAATNSRSQVTLDTLIQKSIVMCKDGRPAINLKVMNYAESVSEHELKLRATRIANEITRKNAVARESVSTKT